MTPEEREELLTAYALGTLSAPDAAAVRDLVRRDRGAAAQLAEYHDIADLITLSVPLRRADPSLRARVLEAARREPREQRRFRRRTLIPWAAAAAVAVLAVLWGASVQGELEALRRENVALTSVVESDAKRLDTLLDASAGPGSLALGLELLSTTAELQLAMSVTSDPDVRSSVLDATAFGHGAAGHFLWSDELDAGTVTAHGLPPLPLGQSYQVWLSDSRRWVWAGALAPDERGDVDAAVVRTDFDMRPVRIMVTAAPAGESPDIATTTVLEGVVGP